MGHAVGLDDLTVGNPVSEGIADRVGVGAKAIRADLGQTDHATAQVLHEAVRIVAIAFADVVGNDRLLRSGDADENVLVAFGRDLMGLHVLLLLADEGPHLVQLETVDPDANHDAVVKLEAAATDTQSQGGDGLAVDARDPRGGSDAHALSQGGNDLNLLFASENVHGIEPQLESLRSNILASLVYVN